MGLQEGRNAGVTGIIDLPGAGGKFAVWARAFNANHTAAMLDAAGRGDSEWPELRPMSSGGSVVVGGQVRLDGYPVPTKFRGEAGTLTLQQHTNVKATYPVRVEGASFKKNDKEQGLWEATYTCRIVGEPTFSGFDGTQPIAATETFGDKELWAGTSKSIDPQGLQSGATRRTLWWGVGDSDAAELAKINAYLSAIAQPFTTLKVRVGTFTRTSKNAAYFEETWGLTDTAEDVVNPRTVTTLDTNHLGSVATAAAINATPATPGGDSFVLRTTDSMELNDGHQLKTCTFGLRDTKDDVEMPQTVTGNDPYDLEDTGSICKVTQSSTPPTAPTAPVGELLEVETTQLNRLNWQHVFKYGNLNSQQKREFPESPVDVDPSAIVDEDHQAQVTGSQTPPTDPTPRVTGLKLRRRRSIRVSGTPVKWMHIWEFGRRSTQDDIEMPATVTLADGSNLKDNATVCKVTSSGTPPTPPAAPVGQLVETQTEQIHGSDTTKWKHTFRYANNTNQQDVEFAGTATGEDPQDLTDDYRETQVNGSSTPPADPTPTPSTLKLRKRISQRIGGTPTKWKHTWEFGRRNTQEDIEMPGSITELDISNLKDKGTATQVTTSSTPPTPPSAPVGQLVRTESEQLYSGRWRHTFTYSNNTAQQEVEFGGSATDEDPQDLEDGDQVTIVNGSSTPPGTPTPTPSTLKLRKRVSKRIGGTPTKWSHTFTFAVRTTKDDIQQLNTFTTTDPSDLTSDGKQAIVYDTAASTPTPSIPSGQQVVSTKFGVIHDGKKRVDFEFGKDTSQQKVEQARTKTVADPNNLTSEGTTAALDATPASLGGVYVVRDTLTEPITHDHSVNVKRHGLRDTKDDEQMPNTFNVIDPLAIETEGRKAEVYTTSGGVPAAATPPTGTQLVTTRILELNRVNSIRHSTFGVLNSEQKRTFPKTSTTDDGQDLEDAAARAEFWTVGNTPPALPSNPPGNNVKLITFTDYPETPTRNIRVWLYGTKNTRDQIVLPNFETNDDPSLLESTAMRAGLDGETITDPVGYVLRFTKTFPRTVGLGVNRTLTVKVYGLRTTQQDVEFPGTISRDDPQDLIDEGQITLVTSSGTPPTTPTAPVGTKVFKIDSQQLTGGKWKHTWQYRRRNSSDEIVMDGTVTRDDPTDLDDSGTITQVTTSATPPGIPTAPTASSVHVGTDSTQLHDTRWRHTFRYAAKTNQQAIEFDGTETTDDPQNLADAGSITSVTASGTPPGIPSAPSGTKHRRTITRQLTSGKWAHRFEYAERNTSDEVTQDGTRTDADPNVLTDEATITLLAATSTLPGAPTPPTGQKLVGTTSRQLNDNKWAHTFTFGVNDTKDRIQYGHSNATSNPIQTFRQDQSTVTADATDLGTLITAQFNANKTDASFDGHEIRRLSSGQVEIIKKVNNGDKILTMSLRTERVLMRATPSVMVSQVIARANGKWALIVPQSMLRTTGRVVLRRRKIGTSPTDDTILFLGVLGRMNVSTFLGIPSNSLLYDGPELLTNAGLTGGRLLDTGYGFSYDSNAFIDDSQVALGWVFTTGSPVVGLNSPSIFGWVVGNPATADYSGFIA